MTGLFFACEDGSIRLRGGPGGAGERDAAHKSWRDGEKRRHGRQVDSRDFCSFFVRR